MPKGVDENIDEGVFRWSSHVERMENDGIAKRVYVGECVGIRSEGRVRKRWIDTAKKRGLGVRKARIILHDRSLWRGFVRGNARGVARGMNP